MNWSVFFTRLGSAIIFAAVMMAGLLWSNPFAILFLAILIQFLCIKEFWKLMEATFPDTDFPKWLHGSFQIMGLLIIISLVVSEILFLFPLLFLLFSNFLLAVLSKKTAFIAFMCGLLSLLYIAVPMGFLVMLKQLHLAIPLAIILMIWTNDTMAYIVGSFIGKTSFSSISPKKTWEGVIGGGVLTLLGAGIWGYFANIPMFTMVDWLILGVIVVFAGTTGDLLESKLKRIANVKDSGNIMPGHGGALDRFDSLLITLPFVFCYVYFFMMPN